MRIHLKIILIQFWQVSTNQPISFSEERGCRMVGKIVAIHFQTFPKTIENTFQNRHMKYV